MWENFGIFLATGVGGIIAGAVVYLLGGLAVDRRINRRLTAVEDEVDHLEGRLSQEVKRRASQMGNEARNEKRSLRDQAEQYLAHKQDPEGTGLYIDPVFTLKSKQ